MDWEIGIGGGDIDDRRVDCLAIYYLAFVNK